MVQIELTLVLGSYRGMVGSDKEIIDGKCASKSSTLLRYLAA